MSAGFKYDLTPKTEYNERYDVKSGVLRISPYRLDTSGLSEGYVLPAFAPIAADLKSKTAAVVRNVEVCEDYTTGPSNLTIRIKKNSLAYVGMFIGNGSKGAEVAAIDKTGAAYDELSIKAAFGVNLPTGTVLFEATAVGGTKPKQLANSALYERKKIEEGINLIGLLHVAYEIEPDKLVLPFSAKDKEQCPFFQFNE